MNFGINFGSNIMEMQSSAGVADSQMGMVGLMAQKDRLISQVGQMPAQDMFEREKKIDMEMAKLDTFEKMHAKNEKAAKEKKKRK